ncbi:MAG: hypothetical protein H7840_05635 [Alphaproteobacteria bacterium]
MTEDPLSRLVALYTRYDGPIPEPVHLAACHGAHTARLGAWRLAEAHGRFAADVRAELSRRRATLPATTATGDDRLRTLTHRLAGERAAATRFLEM